MHKLRDTTLVHRLCCEWNTRLHWCRWIICFSNQASLHYRYVVNYRSYFINCILDTNYIWKKSSLFYRRDNFKSSLRILFFIDARNCRSCTILKMKPDITDLKVFGSCMQPLLIPLHSSATIPLSSHSTFHLTQSTLILTPSPQPLFYL